MTGQNGAYSDLGGWTNKLLQASDAKSTFTAADKLKVVRTGTGTQIDPYVYTFTYNLITEVLATTTDSDWYKVSIITRYDDDVEEGLVSLPTGVQAITPPSYPPSPLTGADKPAAVSLGEVGGNPNNVFQFTGPAVTNPKL